VTVMSRSPLPSDAPRHAVRGRRNRLPGIGWSAFCLTASTLLLVGSLALTLTTPFAPPEPPAAMAAASDVVPRFYAALDAMLAGASPGAGDSALSPALVVAETGAPDQSLADWLRRLRSSHPLATTLQLTPTAQTVEGDRIAVAIQFRAIPGAPVNPAAPVSPARTTLDHLTIAGGQVVAYAPGPALEALPLTLPPAPLPALTQPTNASLVRLRLAPGAELASLVGPGPDVMLGEQGAASAIWQGGGLLARADDADGWRSLPDGAHNLALAVGDALIVPADTFHGVRNAGANPAELLLLAEFPASALNPTMVPARYGSMVHSLVDLANPHWAGLPRHPATGVEATVLVSAMDGLGGDRCPRALTISRRTLAPGDVLPAHRVDGVELTAAEGAWLTIGGDPMPGSGNSAAAEAPIGIGSSASIAPLARNDGAAPLRLVDLTLAPARTATCAKPAG
jgi:hypothetical protein